MTGPRDPTAITVRALVRTPDGTRGAARPQAAVIREIDAGQPRHGIEKSLHAVPHRTAHRAPRRAGDRLEEAELRWNNFIPGSCDSTGTQWERAVRAPEGQVDLAGRCVDRLSLFEALISRVATA